jgi:hypothetical protein
MNNRFLSKVKYTKQLENGTFKRVSELYLFDAQTFTDSEARIYEELGSVIRGEFIVSNIGRYTVEDIFFFDDSDVYWRLKIQYETSDVDSDRQQKVTKYFLVTARTPEEASDRLRSELSTLMVSFEIKSVIETAIVEYFPFSISSLNDTDKEVNRMSLPTTDVEE